MRQKTSYLVLNDDISNILSDGEAGRVCQRLDPTPQRAGLGHPMTGEAPVLLLQQIPHLNQQSQLLLIHPIPLQSRVSGNGLEKLSAPKPRPVLPPAPLTRSRRSRQHRHPAGPALAITSNNPRPARPKRLACKRPKSRQQHHKFCNLLGHQHRRRYPTLVQT